MDQTSPEKFQLSDLSLRPLSISDVEDFMVWASDEKVTQFCSYGPYTNKEQGINYITNNVLQHPWFMAICLNNKPIGAISVSKNSGNDKCRGELGYVLGSESWGKGIATWAVREVARSIFKECPEMERLEAFTEVDNVGSQKVLEKVGFFREGVLRKYWVLKGVTKDCVVFSLLSTDPVL
ncbi:Acyl-CoA N-acyltransferases (NAT) superfamily protein [Euphorbia peplus]|nr:Acyl-CoA N-acyltransferases (NAT) superfamily protein [Euphorbia peplus]